MPAMISSFQIFLLRSHQPAKDDVDAGRWQPWFFGPPFPLDGVGYGVKMASHFSGT